MSKDEVHELLMGAALVALGYALYQHFKTKPATAPMPAITTPAQAVENNYTTTGPSSPFTSLTDLLTGTVHDIGGFGGTNYLAQIETGGAGQGTGALW
ncbi:MAG: hypothetical protein ACXVZR_03770 [Terriglobales bacterium]